MNKISYVLLMIFALLIVNSAEAKKKKYPNGDYYEGGWKKKSPNGLGKMTYANGNVYNGNWVFGIKEGQGTMTYKDDKKYKEYIGEWKADKPNGIGKAMFRNGDTYEGNWSMGKIHGDGTFTYANGDVFTGTWSETGRNGNLTMKNGNMYTGEWKGNEFYNGKCLIRNGNNSFEGEIKDGEYYNGEGDIIENGNHYKGKWINGCFLGYCEIKADGTNPDFAGNILNDGSMDGTVEYRKELTYKGALSSQFIPNGNGTLSGNTDSHSSFEINGYWDNGNLVKLNKSCVTIDPITISMNATISSRQVLSLNQEGNMLMLFDNSISNQYDQISNDIAKVTKNIIDISKEKYIAANLKTYRVEDYKLCRWDRGSMGVTHLYSFGDAEYQKNPFSGNFHGTFHIWNGRYFDWEDENNSYSVKGLLKEGKKDGEWVYERRNDEGELTGRLIINYENNLKSGFSTLETIDENGSKTIIKAYYDKDHWDKMGTSYYCYSREIRKIPWPLTSYVETKITITERKIAFDENGQPHGEIFMKHNDIELKGKFNHGKLVSIEKRNVKKGVNLTPINAEKEFKDLWELNLPAAFPVSVSSNFRFDRNPFIGLTMIDLTAEGIDFDYEDASDEAKKKTNY